jgi:hypothetical protein
MSLPMRPRLLCLLCQYRPFSTSYRRLAEQAKKTTAATAKPTLSASAAVAAAASKKQIQDASPLQNAPRGYGERVENFTPVPLPRPIGMLYPPEVGQNTGVDNRSIKQRRADFVDWEKHLVRREELYVSVPVPALSLPCPCPVPLQPPPPPPSTPYDVCLALVLSHRYLQKANRSVPLAIERHNSASRTSVTGPTSRTTRARRSSPRRGRSRATCRCGSRTCTARRCSRRTASRATRRPC